MKVLDLFAGIGGFSLGLERAGMETVAFCEIEDYPRKVLAKHWPGVPIYEDVKELTSERLRADGLIGRDGIDVITAGFPCQDISTAGKGAGIEGERSGLWSEIARLAGELRPRYIILENVSALLSRGLDKVLGDLAEIGYDAEWHCIPASHLGAPHRRDRWWCVCYPDNYGFPAAEITRGAGTGSYHSKTGSKSACEPTRPNQQQPSVADTNESIATQDDANADSQRPHRAHKHINRSGKPADGKERKPRSVREVLAGSGNTGKRRSEVADTSRTRIQARSGDRMGTKHRPSGNEEKFTGTSGQTGEDVADTNSQRGRSGNTGRENAENAGQSSLDPGRNAARMGGGQSKPNMGILAHGLSAGLARSRWLPEPGVGRVAAGIPDRTARLKALGNSLIPQMPELIGRVIMAIEAEKRSRLR